MRSFNTSRNPRASRTRRRLLHQHPLPQREALSEGSVESGSAAERKLLQVLPDVFDLRAQGVVPPVRNQRSCGACWSFAALGALETRAQMLGLGASFDNSEQQLVDW